MSADCISHDHDLNRKLRENRQRRQAEREIVLRFRTKEAADAFREASSEKPINRLSVGECMTAKIITKEEMA